MSLGKSATPLGKVRGLGSAQSGGAHWLHERFSSVVLVLLSIWLIASMALLPDHGQATLQLWIRQPLTAVPLALFVLAAFEHGVAGMKVVIDDYVHDEGNRVAAHFLLAMAGIAGAAFALYGLAKILFGA